MGAALTSSCAIPHPSTWSDRARSRQIQDRPTGSLRDNYDLGEVLGKGRTGVVRSGICRKTGDQVAVKMVDHAETPIEMIRNDVDMMKSLSHNNLVQFHTLFIDDCHVHLVMSCFSGGDLLNGLSLHRKLGCRQTVHISRQVALAVQHLHQKRIVHRDIKGDNFLADRKDITDPECHVALGDFDTACVVEEGERITSQAGTKLYWSPEVYNKDYGPKADVFAMGVLNYGLLTGRFPFMAEKQLRNDDPRMPEGLDRACEVYVLGMLEKDEAKRLDANAVANHDWTSGDWDLIEGYTDVVPTLTTEFLDVPGTDQEAPATKQGLDLRAGTSGDPCASRLEECPGSAQASPKHRREERRGSNTSVLSRSTSASTTASHSPSKLLGGWPSSPKFFSFGGRRGSTASSGSASSGALRASDAMSSQIPSEASVTMSIRSEPQQPAGPAAATPTAEPGVAGPRRKGLRAATCELSSRLLSPRFGGRRG